MGLSYVFDVGKHTNLCLTEGKGKIERRLEVLYSPMPTIRRLGWEYLETWPGRVIAFVDPDLKADDAMHRLRKLHAEVRDHGVRPSKFKLATNTSWSQEPNGRPSGIQKLEYHQWWMATPAAKLDMNWNNDVQAKHVQLYRGEFYLDHIVHRPVLQTYQTIVVIGQRTSNAKVLRHLRRFIRHVERFGLGEHDSSPLQ